MGQSHAHGADGHGGHGPHAHGSAAARSQRSLLLVLALTGGYTVAEVAGGLLTGSLALVADAGHMLTDTLGLAMALAAIRFAQRPATPEKTYGFYRTEILAALLNCLILFGVGAYIVYEAWRRFQEPPHIDSLPMLGVAVGGLLVNLFSARVLHAEAQHSLNAEGAFLEVLSDLLGSVGVIAAALIVYFTGWWPADPLISVGIALFIFPRTWRLLRSVLDVLLEAAPAHLPIARLEAAMRAVPGVLSVHELHVWTITSGFVAMSAHVTAHERSSADVLHDLQLTLRKEFGIQHATLQVEQSDHADDGACCTLDPRCLVVGSTAAMAATVSDASAAASVDR